MKSPPSIDDQCTFPCFSSVYSLPANRTGRINPATSFVTKRCVNKLSYDDVVSGDFADHFGTHEKCREKAQSVLEYSKKDKQKHTVFCIDLETKKNIAESIKKANMSDWIDKPPKPGANIILPYKLIYWTCEKRGDGISCDSGQGYPIVRVNPKLSENAYDKECPEINFYAPHHLQGVERIPVA
jgi:hypothetical protein